MIFFRLSFRQTGLGQGVNGNTQIVLKSYYFLLVALAFLCVSFDLTCGKNNVTLYFPLALIPSIIKFKYFKKYAIPGNSKVL